MQQLINLYHLKFFCDAIAYQSISEAAKMNYITQSAISQAINKLETVFGVQLLIHNNQKLMITPEGQIVYNQAKEIFKAVKETFNQVNLTKKEVAGRLTFVTTKSLGMSFFASTYAKIKKNLPQLELKFKMGGKNFIRNALKREEVEFAIVVYDHNFSQFAKRPIKKGCLHLYQSKKAPKNLVNQGIFIDENDGMHIHNLREFLTLQNQSIDTKEIAGWELVARFTELGLGVGFFPDYLLANNRFPHLKIHPIQLPPFEYEIAAIYNKSSKLSRAAYAFIEQFTLDE